MNAIGLASYIGLTCWTRTDLPIRFAALRYRPMPDTRGQLAPLGKTDAEIETWLALESAGARLAALAQLHALEGGERRLEEPAGITAPSRE
jgi:hypothetical protein